MRLYWSLLPCLLGLSLSSFATGWYPSQEVTQSTEIDLQPLRCPTIGKDYAQMITELSALQDKISKDANCGQLVKNLEQIGQLSGERRTNFLEIIAKINRGEAVSDRNMENYVINYAEDVTVAAGSLATLLTQSGQCFGEQDMSSSLFALSSFVNEASTLLSTVAGPWGPALSIGGKVAAGFLSGVNRFIQSLPGYDFKDKKDWQGYVETLCAFHEQQDEVYALIHPESAVRELQNLNKKLETQLFHLLERLPQGSQLYSTFQAEDNEGLIKITQEMDDKNPNKDGLKAVRLLTAQKWIHSRIEAIEVEAQDPLAPGQYLVQKQRNEIEDFLIARQGPKFIDFQVRESQKALKELENVLIYNGIGLAEQIRRLTQDPDTPRRAPYTFMTPQEALTTVLQFDENQLSGKGLVEDQLYSSLIYFKREIGKRWDAVAISYGVKTSFCTFFERAGYYNRVMQGSCTAYRAKNVEASMNEYVDLGLRDVTPPYLKKAAHYAGLTWTQSLDTWLNELQ